MTKKMFHVFYYCRMHAGNIVPSRYLIQETHIQSRNVRR